jgi:hypothetical protein
VRSSLLDASPLRVSEIEGEVGDLGQQVGNLAQAGTDFAIRLHRSTTRLITAVEELRSRAIGGARPLPQDFWNRTAAAITALTAIRTAARAVLRDDV